MHILIIEARYRTWFWEAVAKSLEPRGVRVSWLVQNPVFAPRVGNVIHLEHPKLRSSQNTSVSNHATVSAQDRQRLVDAAAGDRSILYWGGTSEHYVEYWEQVERIIVDLGPTMVLGELGNFHTLLVAEACKKHGIQFVCAETSRYPQGRFSFFAGTECIPIFGEGESAVEDVDVDSIVDGIVSGGTTPTYMSSNVMKPPISRRIRRLLLQGSNSLRSVLIGERFNQKPLRIAVADIVRRPKNKRKWNDLAIEHIQADATDSGYRLLFPLQMQPELNLDVWGNAYRNQTQLLQDVLDALPNGWTVYVKPNPKTDREVTEELIDVIRSERRVYALPFGIRMADLFDQVDAILTVTGTVAIEAVLRSKPVFVLADTIVTSTYPEARLESTRDLGRRLSEVANGTWEPYVDPKEVLRQLLLTSYPGVVSAPHSSPKRTNPENIELVTAAVMDALKRTQWG